MWLNVRENISPTGMPQVMTHQERIWITEVKEPLFTVLILCGVDPVVALRGIVSFHIQHAPNQRVQLIKLGKTHVQLLCIGA
jgi:hypothetical protein